jgi:tripartite-type tricarboxylate transporter receptor subunit TctC
MTAMLGGNVDVLVTAMPTAMSQIKGGTILPLGVTSSQRSTALPSIPTAIEGGVPFVASNWIGLTVPVHTPREAIDWMQKALAAAVAAPDVRERFLAQGAEPSGLGADAFGALMKSETSRWGEVIRAARIAAE